MGDNSYITTNKSASLAATLTGSGTTQVVITLGACDNATNCNSLGKATTASALPMPFAFTDVAGNVAASYTPSPALFWF
jgi:hypothetical protein